MSARVRLAAGALAAVFGLGATAASGGVPSASSPAASPRPAPAPPASAAPQGPADSSSWRFAVGERSRYDVYVKLGPVGAPRPLGEAVLSVEAEEVVRGTPVYRASLEIEGSVPLVYKMNNRQVSWIAPDPVRSLRFEEHLREGDYRRDRRYTLDQQAEAYTRFDQVEAGSWREVETDVPMPANALDEVSFLYFVRTVPLEVGRTYRFDRFFQEDGNPVILEVLRREEVRVPAGRFRTVVVRPIIQTDGLFSQGGKAEVYLSDDGRRRIVQIKSRMKVGTVNMYLTEYRAGGREAREAR